MILFSCKNAGMAFGDDTVLMNIDLQVNEWDRIGIIGGNGAGKTTLLRLFTGEYEPTSGEVFVHSRIRGQSGYLRQDSGLDSQLTVYEEFMKPYAHLKELEAGICETEARLQALGSSENLGHVLSGKLARLYEEYKKQDGLTYESRVRSVLKGLGFDGAMLDLKISGLSGGQKTRLALGKLLLAKPPVLILDEPTNHLDEESSDWLSSELKAYTGTLLIVSHDRYFLDEVTTRTLLIDHSSAYLYNAPYSKYTVLRAADVAYRERQYLNQQKEIARINAFIENQRKWNRERNIIAAESRMKYLDRMEKIDRPEAEEAAPRISFELDAPGANDVLKVSGLGFSYPARTLFENVDFELHRGERLFITGANGCGKTTLLRILAGRLSDTEKPLVSGTFRTGIGITFSYYAQDLSDIAGSDSVFDTVYDRVNAGRAFAHLIKPSAIRGTLSAFGFRGEEVFKSVADLSGGERSRLQLLFICYERRPLLILDEPTNHLDIGSREELEKALLNYPGTCIIVSHDRYFRNRVATSELDLGRFAPGAKADAVKGRSGGAAGKNAPAPEESRNDRPGSGYELRKEYRAKVRNLENAIKRAKTALEAREARIGEITLELGSDALKSDFDALGRLYKEIETLEEESFAFLEELEQAEAELRAAGSGAAAQGGQDDGNG